MKVLPGLFVLFSICQFWLGSFTDASSIIFLHHSATYSHVISTLNFANSLVNNGHNVTYISGFYPNAPHKPDPRITFVIPTQLTEFWEEKVIASFDVGNRLENRMPFLPIEMANLNFMTCELVLTSLEFQNWLKTNPTVDLIYGDLTHECAGGIAYRFKAKYAIFATTPWWGKYNDILGIPDDSSSTESWTYTFPFSAGPVASFLDRATNAVMNVFEYLVSSTANEEKYSKLFNESLHLANDAPSLKELEANVSLVLSTGNYISEFPRSFPPMVVSVPGMHVYETSRKLPQEVEDFLSSRPNVGFVYVSLGTVAKASNLPENIKNVMFDSFSRFPDVNFLWKWEGKQPDIISKNVFLSAWFPQQDILGHQQIKGYITQAGRPSLQESLAKGVPMICIPLLGDQDINAKRMEALGVSINIELKEISKPRLTNALKKVIYDKTMKENALKQAQLFMDLPVKPVELAVWWTEYILRHDDLSHLKPTGRHQTWYQRRQLDVWAFMLFTLFLFSYCVLKVLLFFSRYLFKAYSNGSRKVKIS